MSTKPQHNFIVAIGLIVLGAIVGAVYGGLVYYFNYDPLIIGFPVATSIVTVPVLLFISKKKPALHYKILAIYGMIAVIFAFGARLTTFGILMYEDYILPAEKTYEQEEGSYIDDTNVIRQTDQILKETTGFEGYLGALIYHLQHQIIETDDHGEKSTSQAGFWESLTYLIVEFFLSLWCVGMGFIGSYKKRPIICPNCKNYEKTTFYVIGKIKDYRPMIKALQTKDWHTFKTFYNPQEANKNNFVSLKNWHCTICKNSPITMDIVVSKNGRTQTIAKRFLLTPDAFQELQKIIF